MYRGWGSKFPWAQVHNYFEGQPLLLVPMHYGVSPLNTFPLIRKNETDTNLLMPISAFSMTENLITKFTFVFLLIYDKLVNLEKKFSRKNRNTYVHVFSTAVKFNMLFILTFKNLKWDTVGKINCWYWVLYWILLCIIELSESLIDLLWESYIDVLLPAVTFITIVWGLNDNTVQECKEICLKYWNHKLYIIKYAFICMT